MEETESLIHSVEILSVPRKVVKIPCHSAEDKKNYLIISFRTTILQKKNVLGILF
jgi:hypothetical protein